MLVIAAATAVVFTVLLAIPGPPFLAFVLLTGVLVGATFVLVLVVLRSLLLRAVSMRVELDEVV
jgi:xanthosine utilization system XapX-like protein